MYVGFPDSVETDQRRQFISAEWKTMLRASGIKHNVSLVESHNALGAG